MRGLMKVKWTITVLIRYLPLVLAHVLTIVGRGIKSITQQYI